MAVVIELWTNEGVIGGAEHWWDDVEASLLRLDSDGHGFPLLSRVDPYGDATFTQAELEPLSEELHLLAAKAPAMGAISSKLISLCEAGQQATAAELRFVGD
jgi:hypothetical protein